MNADDWPAAADRRWRAVENYLFDVSSKHAGVLYGYIGKLLFSA